MSLARLACPDLCAWGVFLLLAFAPGAVAEDWITGTGGISGRYSRTTEVGPDAPTLLWSGSLPAFVAQQAVIGEGLVIMPRIGNPSIPTGTWIVAHELNTGAIRWQVQLPFLAPDEWRSRVSAIRDGQVYATRSSGLLNPGPLYALSPADGSIIWESDALVEESTPESLAFAANGDPIVSLFRSVIRIDRTNGDTIWSLSRTTPTGDGALVTVFENRGYIWETSGSGPKITVIDLDTGSRLFSSDPVSIGIIQQVALFVGPDGTVYAPRTQNNPITDFLVAYDDTGTALVERWRIPMGYVPFASHGIGHDGTVYAYRTVTSGSEVDLNLIRIDPETGAILDTSPTILSDLPVQPRLAIDAAGKVFLTNGGFSNGKIVCFDAELSIIWSEAIPNVNLGGPAIGPGGVLVVCGVGTDVRAYRTNNDLTLNAPDPGIAGVTNTILFRGATPGERVLLTFGTAAGSTSIPPCSGLSLAIADPRLRGAFTADASGEISLMAPVPVRFRGFTLYVQALERTTCRLSNPVVVTLR